VARNKGKRLWHSYSVNTTKKGGRFRSERAPAFSIDMPTYCFDIQHNNVFKPISPKMAPPVVTPKVIPGKVNLDFTHKFRFKEGVECRSTGKQQEDSDIPNQGFE
jgi:hypothetical protein